MKKLLLALLPLATSIAIAQKNEDAAQFANTISPVELKEKLTIVAGADMEGRETAMPGQKKAAAYIEAQFKKIGLKPGNGKSYQQTYPVYRDELLSKKLSVNGKVFEWDKDYSFDLPTVPKGSLLYRDNVFVGYGIVDTVNKTNDYNNIDVKGKVVIILDGTPEGKPLKGFTQRTTPASYNNKIRAAKSRGALGLIVISNDFTAKTATPLTSNLYREAKRGESSFFTAEVSYEVGSALVGRTFTIAKDDWKEINKRSYIAELKIEADKATQSLESSNVIGILPGTDKAEEYVFLTAHYDHLGIRGGKIYYGADDDGSGTVSVIEMAESFAAAKKKSKGPRRTIVFMTVSGEEKGLWGSEYYTDNPIFPLAKTSVDLNTDMVGRIDPSYKGDSLNYVFLIGDDKLSSDLTIIADSVNKHVKMEVDKRYNDVKDPNRFYYRSDHYNFAKNGVPVLFYFNGVHPDYHKPTDTVDKINFELMAKRVKLIFNTAWAIANKEEMLKRDIPLNIPGR